MAIYFKNTTFFMLLLSIFLICAKQACAEYVEIQGRKYSNESFEGKGSIRRFLVYQEDDQEAPEYRKVFDEYILDAEKIQAYGEMPTNRKKDADLAKMNYNGPIKLK